MSVLRVRCTFIFYYLLVIERFLNILDKLLFVNNKEWGKRTIIWTDKTVGIRCMGGLNFLKLN